jgi:hypothetical protein
MRIIDDFFSNADLKIFKDLLEKEVVQEHRQNVGCDFNDYKEICGIENSDFYPIKLDAKKMFINRLVEKSLIDAEGPDSKNILMRYLKARAPYQGLWHQDRFSDSGEVDVIGLTFFLNENWNYADGGLYLYKDQGNEDGYFVIPKDNRLMFNDTDREHGVTPITNPNVVRKSVQVFMYASLLKTNDYYR